MIIFFAELSNLFDFCILDIENWFLIPHTEWSELFYGFPQIFSDV